MRAHDLRPMLRVPFAAVLLALVVSLFTVPAIATASTKKATTHKATKKKSAKKKKAKKLAAPTVSAITPLKLSVGDLMKITGKSFRAGTGKNTVIFRKVGGGSSIFASTLSATTTQIQLKVPTRLNSALDVVNGISQPTKFQIQVVAVRATGTFTSAAKSPTILPQPGGSATADNDKDGIPDNIDPDDDNDGLTDALEIQIGTNPDKADTDGDGVWDSFEYESALDLNVRALPYPGKKPYPNPLDGSDANSDFDGDGLLMWQEAELWMASGHPFPLNYSDGDQYTGGPIEAPVPDVNNYDVDALYCTGSCPQSLKTGVGYISDDEKDFDGDGLSNEAEFNGPATQAYWTAFDSKYSEQPYTGRPFADTSPIDPDSDGDGIPDGQDDQDDDGWPNAMEMYRAPTVATGFKTFAVNPFNPCLPDYRSRTCDRYVSFASPPTPFSGGADPDTLDKTDGWPLGAVAATQAIAPSPDPGFTP
jgi:hypothetical protein